MYNIAPESLRLGMTLRDVVDLRYAAGTGPQMSKEDYATWRDEIAVADRITETVVELRNGAIHEIHHEPTPGGGWVATFDDITERRRAEARMHHMARHDALTDLPNRHVFRERLELALARTCRGDRLAVLCLDLDCFKAVNTPTALSVASLSARAKIPQVIMVAATSSIMDKSPYMVRTAQTIPQIAKPIAEWAVKNGTKSFVSVVSGYGPGLDAEEWFSKTLETEGGTIKAKLRVPLANPDFAPFLQRAADDKPEALFVFVPTGAGAAFMKQFVERGLDKSGIKMIAMSDVADDDLLNRMGDAALGVVTGGPYSVAHDSTANKDFVAKFKAANAGMRPNMVAVGAWDALTLIYKALDKTGVSTTGDGLLAAMKGQSWESPRGPITIDAKTRDIVQNIYMRKVERSPDGELYNVEFATIPNVRDPAR